MSLIEVATTISAIAALGAVIVSILNMSNIHEVHLSINSRLDHWLLAARNAGILEGRASEKKENDARAKPPDLP